MWQKYSPWVTSVFPWVVRGWSSNAPISTFFKPWNIALQLRHRFKLKKVPLFFFKFLPVTVRQKLLFFLVFALRSLTQFSRAAALTRWASRDRDPSEASQPRVRNCCFSYICGALALTVNKVKRCLQWNVLKMSENQKKRGFFATLTKKASKNGSNAAENSTSKR